MIMAMIPFRLVSVYVTLSCLVILQMSNIEAENVSVTFQFNASTANRVLLDGDARFLPGNVIELTNSTQSLFVGSSAGRAVYNETIPLWSASTNAVADFTTHFLLQINWTKTRIKNVDDVGGDGIAFFMAAPESGFHVPYRGGSSMLGLFGDENNGNSSKLVAVEFDTFPNEWDPQVSNHLGIDVNNITSVANISLDISFDKGKIWDAWIDYLGRENMLKVSVSERRSNAQGRTNLSYNIDLTKCLPENIVVGLSSGASESSATHMLLSWSFNSTISQPPDQNRKKSVKVVIIALCVSCLIMVILCFFVLHLRRKKQTSNDKEEEDADMNAVLDHVPGKFTYQELSVSTNNFSEKEKLGQGGFGGVYKGFLAKTNETVAVKRISEGSKQGKKEYLAEITTITRLRHRNLVPLLGWCHEKGQLLVVYEYMPNGSLDNFLFKNGGRLDWLRRYKIAIDIASALLYLHELWDECVVHRDVKSSNIMLDADFNAKLGDFGLARLVKHNHCQSLQTTTVAGTMGYIAPEVALTRIPSAESDVFSFGAVALELACGRPALDLSLEKPEMLLLEWVWDMFGKGRILDAADSSLNGEFDKGEMEQLLVIGLWCSHPYPGSRPKMRQVLQILNFEIPMPNLPPAMPVYSPLPAFFSNISSARGATSEEVALFSDNMQATSSSHVSNSISY